jgi:UDP-glucose-4-epimerase GalE
VADVALMQDLIHRHQIAAVIHFAGFKAVGESVAQPLQYFENNLGGMMALLNAMQSTTCRTLVFSSSAKVYGDPASVPIAEDFPRSHTNPYGHTNLVCEDMLAAMRVANPAWRTGVLRYFNPVGAHPSGLIGEDPAGPPNNLMPYVAQVAVGKRPFFNVYGNDYATPDGTGVRDYIHVQDLALAHVAAVQTLLQGADNFTVNVVTGQGYSVLVSAFWKLYALLNKPVAIPCLTSLTRAVPVMWPNAMRTQHLHKNCWVGVPSTRWLTCARMPGAGKATIQMAIFKDAFPALPYFHFTVVLNYLRHNYDANSTAALSKLGLL